MKNTILKFIFTSVLVYTSAFANTLTGLKLESNATTLNVGEKVTLTLMGTYSDNSTKVVDKNVTYIIIPADKAEVNGSILTALKDGNVTVQATVGGVASNSVKLHITWVVDGHVLPPKPDKTLNDSTLLGIDSNNNGVRDDVERWIYEEYTQPIERGIFMQTSRAYNMLIVDPSKAHETKKYSDNAVSCLFYWFRKENSPLDRFKNYDDSKKLKRIQFNTLKRHINYDKYQKALSGGVYDLLPKYKEKCEFDENGILGELK